VSISEDGATEFSGSSSANNLILFSTGTLTNAASASVSVTNHADLTIDTSINLGNQSGDTISFGSLQFSSQGAVNIAADSAVSLRQQQSG
jgi:hypothetical protein